MLWRLLTDANACTCICTLVERKLTNHWNIPRLLVQTAAATRRSLTACMFVPALFQVWSTCTLGVLVIYCLSCHSCPPRPTSVFSHLSLAFLFLSHFSYILLLMLTCTFSWAKLRLVSASWDANTDICSDVTMYVLVTFLYRFYVLTGQNEPRKKFPTRTHTNAALCREPGCC